MTTVIFKLIGTQTFNRLTVKAIDKVNKHGGGVTAVISNLIGTQISNSLTVKAIDRVNILNSYNTTVKITVRSNQHSLYLLLASG